MRSIGILVQEFIAAQVTREPPDDWVEGALLEGKMLAPDSGNPIEVQQSDEEDKEDEEDGDGGDGGDEIEGDDDSDKEDDDEDVPRSSNDEKSSSGGSDADD